MPIKSQMEEMPVLNLTSMIDVLFLLIIFFVVGTRFNDAEREIELQVPEVGSAGALTDAPQKRIVNVYRDGAITLDQETVTLEQLTDRLAAARGQYKRLGVMVRGDGNGQFQLVASVLNACKQAGISELGISVRVANTEPNRALR